MLVTEVAGARKFWNGNVDIPVRRITAKNLMDCSVTKGDVLLVSLA